MEPHSSLAASALGITLWILAVILWNGHRKNYDVMSWRSFFLLGFLFFFGIGSFFAATKGVGNEWYVPQPSAYTTLAWVAPLFLVVFFIAGRIGFASTFQFRALPRLNYPRTPAFVFSAAAAMVAFAVAAAIVIPEGYFSGFFTVFKSGFGAAAVGLAVYLLGVRPKSPVHWAFFISVLGVSAIVGTVGETGRRGFLSVLLAVPWMWYFVSLRYKRLSSMSGKLVVLGVALFAVIAVYSSFRGVFGYGEGADFASRARQLARITTYSSTALKQMERNLYTDTANNTMFIIDAYPGRYDHIPGNGAGLFFGMPVPRSLWPDKPVGLGLQLKSQMNVPSNLGAGIIGHGWAEASLIGVLGYAVFFGLLTGAMDRVIADRSWNPFFIAAIGASLGNVIGLPRGETSIFLALVVAAFIGTWLVLAMFNMVFGRVLGVMGSPMPPLGDSAATNPAGRHGAFDNPEEEHFLVDPDLAAAYAGEPAAVTHA